MSEAWGTTGRVTVHDRYEGILTEVYLDEDTLDEVLLGHFYPDDKYAWDARACRFSPVVPTLDAAVMWILRRTVPSVWRAERPVVYRVVRGPDVFPMGRWHLHYADADDRSWNPNCVPEHVDSDPTWESAFPYAVRRASAEYAARAAR